MTDWINKSMSPLTTDENSSVDEKRAGNAFGVRYVQ